MTLQEAELALASLPIEFVEVEGCTLVQDRLTPGPRILADHLERCAGDRSRVEATVNRRFVVAHLLDPLMKPPLGSVFSMSPAVHEAIGRIAEARADRLRAALRREFPGRRFRVEAIGTDDVAEEPLEVCVTVSCVR